MYMVALSRYKEGCDVPPLVAFHILVEPIDGYSSIHMLYGIMCFNSTKLTHLACTEMENSHSQSSFRNENIVS